MKSRIPEASKIIILYNIPEASEKYLKISKLLEHKNVSVKAVGEDKLSQSIGFLAGFNGFQERPNNSEENIISIEECMILSGFDRKNMNELLASLRNEQIDITLKAIVTASNRIWSLSKLLENLLEEHSALNKPKGV